MELRQLRHFLALAEERGLIRAARREHIVQSGLSYSIAALERELGTELYVRGTRPVRLTAAGEALVGPARRTVATAAEAARAVHEVTDVVTGSLRVGVIQAAQHLVPFVEYLASFTALHPGVDVRLLQAPVLTMLEMVAAGELDCAIAATVPEAVGRVRLVPLASEPLLLACRADHRLAALPEVVLADLADERFVEVHEHWGARIVNDATFAAAGVPRRIVCEVNEWLLFLELVDAGLGIGFVPAGLDYPILTRADSRLRLLDVADVDFARHAVLALPTSDLNPAAVRFADHVCRLRNG
ncbi:LysR family transcriptional regulator [Umezawaea sp. NPDC059074]|uniref:LysR family transcriptional regulator n=1 Tax=Umezawaea sp. NPDC059074 TaxID=3346716 RepID=UPI0036CE4A99